MNFYEGYEFSYENEKNISYKCVIINWKKRNDTTAESKLFFTLKVNSYKSIIFLSLEQNKKSAQY